MMKIRQGTVESELRVGLLAELSVRLLGSSSEETINNLKIIEMIINRDRVKDFRRINVCMDSAI
jgi:hypothetical protein